MDSAHPSWGTAGLSGARGEELPLWPDCRVTWAVFTRCKSRSWSAWRTREPDTRRAQSNRCFRREGRHHTECSLRKKQRCVQVLLFFIEQEDTQMYCGYQHLPAHIFWIHAVLTLRHLLAHQFLPPPRFLPPAQNNGGEWNFIFDAWSFRTIILINSPCYVG